MQHPHAGSPTLQSYVTGLALAVALTVVPFAMVAWQSASRPVLLGVIAVFGFAQVLVHLRYFLHLSLDTSSRERVGILLFSVLLIVIMAAGTIVVMADLNARMM